MGHSFFRDWSDIPNSQIRKVIAKRLTQSKSTVPHAYATIACVMDSLLALRTKMKGIAAVGSVPLQAVTVFLCSSGRETSVCERLHRQGSGDGPPSHPSRCVASPLASLEGTSLTALSAVNARWDEKLDAVVPSSTVDVSVAVATDKGLITPIIAGADGKAVRSISAEVKVVHASALCAPMMGRPAGPGCSCAGRQTPATRVSRWLIHVSVLSRSLLFSPRPSLSPWVTAKEYHLCAVSPTSECSRSTNSLR